MKKFIELFCRKYKLGFSLLFIFLLLMISYLVYINNDSSVKASDSGFEEINDIVGSAVADIKNNQKIKIDVKGLVANPGVYELNEGSRVIDQTTPNMIQRISGIFERNPLISKEI